MEARVKELQAKEDLSRVRPEVNGQEIMSLLHLTPGPQVGAAYKHMLDFRLENGEVGHDTAVSELLRWAAEQ